MASIASSHMCDVQPEHHLEVWCDGRNQWTYTTSGNATADGEDWKIKLEPADRVARGWTPARCRTAP